MSEIDRTQFIGGSDAAAILGVSPWKSAFRLYQEKIGEFTEEITPEKQRVFDRGHRWEPVVAEMVIDELQEQGRDVQIVCRNYRYSEIMFPFLACEIDMELRIDGEDCNVEIKTVHPFAAKEWGEEGSDEIPLHYLAQVMHGLMIVPRRRCIVAALIGVDDLRIHWVDRDEETIAAIRAKEIEFWRRVQERDPPDPTTAEDVKWLYGRDAGIVMDADEEMARICAELHYQKTCASHCEKSIEKLSTRIKLAMGHASTLTYQGQKIATWKSNKASSVTDWQAAFELLQSNTQASAEEICNAIRGATKTAPGNRPLLIK
jgi:putative phage-type endonuclease